MGQVFLAHDLTLEREVAIKVLRPTSPGRPGGARFQQEAKTAPSSTTQHHPDLPVESEGGSTTSS